MNVEMVFVIGSPRSGTTMLERMLGCHSDILGGPEPHLLTPLAHLGVWANVDKAPYDHVLAAESQKHFLERLPRGEQDYWDACRAYCDVLYGRCLQGTRKRYCLDKTPAYALILPFIAKVFPDARYVVLTRHPVATFASYANSFFDGDFQLAHDYNPILFRYVPAIAAFLRQRETPFVHVRYEDLVRDPATWMEKTFDHIGVSHEEHAIEYGGRETKPEERKGLGDPVGVDRHTRPTTASVDKWVADVAADPARLDLVRAIIDRLDPDDLAVFGYPLETLWAPLEQAGEVEVRSARRGLTRYGLQRKLILGLRRRAQKGGLFRKALRKARLTCDVLLRE